MYHIKSKLESLLHWQWKENYKCAIENILIKLYLFSTTFKNVQQNHVNIKRRRVALLLTGFQLVYFCRSILCIIFQGTTSPTILGAFETFVLGKEGIMIYILYVQCYMISIAVRTAVWKSEILGYHGFTFLEDIQFNHDKHNVFGKGDKYLPEKELKRMMVNVKLGFYVVRLFIFCVGGLTIVGMSTLCILALLNTSSFQCAISFIIAILANNVCTCVTTASVFMVAFIFHLNTVYIVLAFTAINANLEAISSQRFNHSYLNLILARSIIAHSEITRTVAQFNNCAKYIGFILCYNCTFLVASFLFAVIFVQFKAPLLDQVISGSGLMILIVIYGLSQRASCIYKAVRQFILFEYV